MTQPTSQPNRSAIGGFSLRQPRAGDVASLVRVHLQSFPGFFLTFLGPKFLKVFYGKTIERPDSICFVSVDSNEDVMGFVVGVTSQSQFFRRLLQNHLFSFGWASIGAVLRRPSIVPRLLRAFNRPRESTGRSADCLLMSLAVHPSAQGSGAGSTLVLEFLKEAGRRGVRAVSLTTDRVGNEGVQRFYESLGFRLDQTFQTAEGRQMNEYVHHLPQVPLG